MPMRSHAALVDLHAPERSRSISLTIFAGTRGDLAGFCVISSGLRSGRLMSAQVAQCCGRSQRTLAGWCVGRGRRGGAARELDHAESVLSSVPGRPLILLASFMTISIPSRGIGVSLGADLLVFNYFAFVG